MTSKYWLWKIKIKIIWYRNIGHVTSKYYYSCINYKMWRVRRANIFLGSSFDLVGKDLHDPADGSWRQHCFQQWHGLPTIHGRSRRTALIGKIGGPHHLNQEQEGGVHLSLNLTFVDTNAWPSWCAIREMVFYSSYLLLLSHIGKEDFWVIHYPTCKSRSRSPILPYFK